MLAPESPDALDRERTQRATDNVNTCLPCKVVRYDPNTQQVDVQPLIKLRVYVEDDLPVDESRQKIVNCPIHFPGDDQLDLSYTIRVENLAVNPPVRPTVGMVFFSQESLDDYLSTGAESGPYEIEKHSLNDGFFVPGLLPFNRPRLPPPENGIRLLARSLDGTQILKLEFDLTTLTMQMSTPARIVAATSLFEVRAEDFVYCKPDGSGVLRLNRDGEWVPP